MYWRTPSRDSSPLENGWPWCDGRRRASRRSRPRLAGNCATTAFSYRVWRFRQPPFRACASVPFSTYAGVSWRLSVPGFRRQPIVRSESVNIYRRNQPMKANADSAYGWRSLCVQNAEVCFGVGSGSAPVSRLARASRPGHASSPGGRQEQHARRVRSPDQFEEASISAMVRSLRRRCSLAAGMQGAAIREEFQIDRSVCFVLTSTARNLA